MWVSFKGVLHVCILFRSLGSVCYVSECCGVAQPMLVAGYTVTLYVICWLPDLAMQKYFHHILQAFPYIVPGFHCESKNAVIHTSYLQFSGSCWSEVCRRELIFTSSMRPI